MNDDIVIKSIPEIFISYAWEKQVDGTNWPLILKNLYRTLTNNNYKVHIDINNVKYKDNIKSFMKELGRGKYIICLISAKYLTSLSCMYEVLQILKYPNYKDRIFPILLNDAKIYESSKIINYLKYWDEQINLLNSEVKSLSNIAYATPIFEDIEIMNEVRRAIAKFGDEISNMNVLTSEIHNDSNFEELLKCIKQKINTDETTMDLTLENSYLKKYIIDLEHNLKDTTEKYSTLKIENEELQKKFFLIDVYKSTEIKEKKSISINDFNMFLGFTKESKIEEVYTVFGDPTNYSENEKYTFETIFFENFLDVSFFKDSHKVTVIRIKSRYYDDISFNNLISEKNIVDEKISFIGKHKDDIIKTFGTPESTASDNYVYTGKNSIITFVCYHFDEYLCSEISVHYLR